MSTPTWPATLPQCLSVGVSRKAQSGKLRTEPDTGPAKTRPRFTAVTVDYPGDMVVTGAQLKAFKDFYNDDLSMGALSFDWIDPLDSSPALVRIKDYEAANMTGGPDPDKRLWRLSLEIEVQP